MKELIYHMVRRAVGLSGFPFRQNMKETARRLGTSRRILVKLMRLFVEGLKRADSREYVPVLPLFCLHSEYKPTIGAIKGKANSYRINAEAWDKWLWPMEEGFGNFI